MIQFAHETPDGPSPIYEKRYRIARSIRQVLGSLKLVQAGGNYSTVKKHIEHFGQPTAHFKGYAWNKGLKVEITLKRALEEILARGVYYKASS